LLVKSYHDCDAEEATLGLPGKYVSCLTIPANLLAPKHYVLKIGATIFGCREIGGDGLRLGIDVLKNGRVNRAYTTNVEFGKLAPLFPWQNQKAAQQQ
jgi:hypothetical protein